jgi:hypothetical protein
VRRTSSELIELVAEKIAGIVVRLRRRKPTPLTASNGTAMWQITRVGKSWCHLYGVVVEDDWLGDSLTLIDHYDPEHPCPGPHGELYAAGPS